MTFLQAAFLGIIQGLTEFLPVSSSGHLVIAQYFMQLDHPPIFFDVVVHAGTLLALIYYFRSRIVSLKPKTLYLIILGTLPAIITGLLIKPYLNLVFSSLHLVIAGLLLTSTLLFTTKFTQKSKSNPLNLKSALLIGLFQAIAIIPGVSRSGASISAGLFSQLSRDDAFSFSFLLSIPAILGALVLQLLDLGSTQPLPLGTLLIGLAASAISGLVAIKLLKYIINHFYLHYFAIYTTTLALILITFL